MTNNDVCEVLEEIGRLLELKGENPFKYRAYFNAVKTLRSLDINIKELIERGELSSIKGIGKALTGKITELVETGKLEYYEKLKSSVPQGLYEMAALPALDRKKVGLIYLKLGAETLRELEEACRGNRISGLRGFSESDQQKILMELEKLKNT